MFESDSLLICTISLYAPLYFFFFLNNPAPPKFSPLSLRAPLPVPGGPFPLDLEGVEGGGGGEHHTQGEGAAGSEGESGAEQREQAAGVERMADEPVGAGAHDP